MPARSDTAAAVQVFHREGAEQLPVLHHFETGQAQRRERLRIDPGRRDRVESPLTTADRGANNMMQAFLEKNRSASKKNSVARLRIRCRSWVPRP